MEADATMPLRSVTAYKNGLYFMVFAAPLPDADHSLVLEVPRRAAALAMETLSVSAAREVVIRYDPAAAAAPPAVFGFDVSSTFASFLSSCVGATVTVASAARPDALTGRVVLVDEEPFALPDKPDNKRTVMRVLASNSEMHSFDLSAVTKLRFDDAWLQTALQSTLEQQVAARRALPSSVQRERIVLRPASAPAASAAPTTAADAELTASFLQRNAPWKLSYRLMIGRETNAGMVAACVLAIARV